MISAANCGLSMLSRTAGALYRKITTSKRKRMAIITVAAAFTALKRTVKAMSLTENCC